MKNLSPVPLLASTEEILRIVPSAPGAPSACLRLALPPEAATTPHARLSFSLRVVRPEGGSTGQAGLVVSIGPLNEQGEMPRPDLLVQSIAIAADAWESFAIEIPTPRGNAPLYVEFRMAYFQETVELRDLAWTSFGGQPPPTPPRRGRAYPGQEPDAPWRAAARERIRRHRMAPLTLRVTDAWGKPVPDARVELRMIRHAYPFGTAVIANRIMDGPPRYETDLNQWRADNLRYRETLLRLFNFAVFENDLKWPVWSERGGDQQERTSRAIDWLRSHGFLVKSHTLLWGSWKNVPSFLRQQEQDPEALRRAVALHIADQTAALRGRIDYADVLNEPRAHNDFTALVGADQPAAWFRAARAGLPGVHLLLNEFDILGNGAPRKAREIHHAFVRSLLDAGAPVDALGFQSHFWSDRLTPPDTLLAVIDEFSAYGLPLHVTEFDMNLRDEALQADYTRDFLTAWFSHPATGGFIMWGFWGGAHWMGDDGAMYRRDWSEKPNLKAYTDLVFGEWWTQADLVTAADGNISHPSFLGEYEIRVNAPGYTGAFRRIRHLQPGTELPVILHRT